MKQKFPDPPKQTDCDSAHEWFFFAVKMSERVTDLRTALSLIWIEEGEATIHAENAIRNDNRRRDNGF